MKFQDFNTSFRRLNILFRSIDSFWKFHLEFFNRMRRRRKYSSLHFYSNKIPKLQRYYYFYFICLIYLFITIFLILPLSLMKLFSTSNDPDFDTIAIYNVHRSTYLSSNDRLVLNIYHQSRHHIYIDIGCFNGETIEHFIHFNPHSIIYDIITFEPDPMNYRMCKQRLSQNKYKSYNIFIIPKVVWIRNEKVSYQTDLGEKSRIDQSETNETSFPQLDAIDFSSWLARLVPSKNTKLRIKLSMPGAEVKLLQKMIVDNTLTLADEWDIEWTDRSNLYTRPVRYYVQYEFNSLGYDLIYHTRLLDERRVFQMKGTYDNVTKYPDWQVIEAFERFVHYAQRPVVTDPPRTTSVKAKLN